MRAIEEFVRVNKIDGSIFISFDLDEMQSSDEIACGALKLECPEFVLPVLFDNSTIVTTLRYSVPDGYKEISGLQEEVLKIEDVICLYYQVLDMLDACVDWYLLPSGFCFNEHYAYVSADYTEIKLMYVPELEADFTGQEIKHLFISLLEKCSQSSGGNIQLQLYKYFYRPKFSIDEFKKMIEKYMDSMPEVVKRVKFKDIQAIEKEIHTEPLVGIEKIEKAIPNLVEKDQEKHEDKLSVLEEKKVAKQPQFVPVQPIEDIKLVQQPEEILQEKDNIDIDIDMDMDMDIDIEERPYYSPKVNKSQLSQEEIEEMVKSIYNGKNLEEKERSKENTNSTIQEAVASKIDGRETLTPNIENGNRKNLFDNAFTPQTVAPQENTPAPPIRGIRCGTLKSISTHARYDLPKQIEIILMDEKFVIGRATRTGEPTGAQFEFAAEITPISRIHAQIERKQGEFYIMDLGSSNGTYLNGVKLEANKPYIIEDGDKIAFAIAYSKNSIEYAFAE